MSYSFRVTLCGALCTGCVDPLARVRVRLSAPAADRELVARAVAAPKDTFALLDAGELQRRAGGVLAEAVTDETGSVTFELDERSYQGGPLDIDVTVAPPASQRGREVAPVSFHVTTVQPQWRKGEHGLRDAFRHCLSERIWCLIKARLGWWTICGRVVTCKDKTAIAGVTVRAFDVDWLDSDALGSAITDGAGKFRIDYTTADFEKTPFSPFINLELIGGPDVYFQIADAGGTLLLDEPRARGRQPDRENRGACFCVELCVDTEVEPPLEMPLFTHVGDFHVYSDIVAASGLTVAGKNGHAGPGFGFFGGIKLKGFVPKTLPADPSQAMKYRFRFEHPANPGVLVNLTGPALVMPVTVGSRLIQWKLVDDTLQWTFQSIVVAGAGATPSPTPTPVGPGPWPGVPDHVIVPDADGWVAVDQMGLDSGFYGPLLRVNTAAIVPGGAVPDDGVGNPVSPVKQRDGVAIKLVFEAAPVAASAPAFSNALDRLLINNWAPVMLQAIPELTGPGGSACNELGDTLTLKHTTDHQLMRSWGLDISSGAVFPDPALPSGTVPRGGFGTTIVDISTWPPCSYRVGLGVTRKLTDGEVDDTGLSTLITFCKG